MTFCYYLLSVCRFHCFFRYACCSSFSFVFMILEISLLSFSLFVYLPVIPIICLFISLSIYGSYLHHILIFALLYFCPLSFSVVSIIYTVFMITIYLLFVFTSYLSFFIAISRLYIIIIYPCTHYPLLSPMYLLLMSFRPSIF